VRAALFWCNNRPLIFVISQPEWPDPAAQIMWLKGTGALRTTQKFPVSCLLPNERESPHSSLKALRLHPACNSIPWLDARPQSHLIPENLCHAPIKRPLRQWASAGAISAVSIRWLPQSTTMLFVGAPTGGLQPPPQTSVLRFFLIQGTKKGIFCHRGFVEPRKTLFVKALIVGKYSNCFSPKNPTEE